MQATPGAAPDAGGYALLGDDADARPLSATAVRRLVAWTHAEQRAGVRALTEHLVWETAAWLRAPPARWEVTAPSPGLRVLRCATTGVHVCLVLYATAPTVRTWRPHRRGGRFGAYHSWHPEEADDGAGGRRGCWHHEHVASVPFHAFVMLPPNERWSPVVAEAAGDATLGWPAGAGWRACAPPLDRGVVAAFGCGEATGGRRLRVPRPPLRVELRDDGTASLRAT